MRRGLNGPHQHIARLDPGSKPSNYLTVTVDHDAIVRARMVRKRRIVDGGDSANAAARVPVVFAGARDPCSGSLDVDLTYDLVVTE